MDILGDRDSQYCVCNQRHANNQCLCSFRSLRDCPIHISVVLEKKFINCLLSIVKVCLIII